MKYESERSRRIQKYEEKMRPKERVRIIEDDYLFGEEIEIPNDVYNLTIAANMTQACSPVEVNFALKQCIIVFFIQIFIAFFWMSDFNEGRYEEYSPQPFQLHQTFVSMISAILF